MLRWNLLTGLLVMLLLPAACVEPYYPKTGMGVGNQLVVNGFIDATHNQAHVSLSRAVALSEAIPSPAEVNANVTLMASNGSDHTLSETDAGYYSVENITIDLSSSYQVRIVTESGSSYTSDPIRILQAPPIDSISWRPKETGVNFYVSGHDPGNNTKFYRWTFNETWEYNVLLWSDYKKDGYLPIFRTPDEWVYSCWQTAESRRVLINSTKHLSQDVVSMFPVHFIPKGSRKFSHFYRFTVRQQAITQDEYEYWQMIEKTTESLGGLFDPLPTQVVGNVHNDEDPNEPVLGYISGGLVQEKHIFIKFLDLPGDLRVIDPYTFECTGRLVYLNELWTVKPSEVYINSFGMGVVEGYVVANENCADCRTLGGDNKRPPDWPTK